VQDHQKKGSPVKTVYGRFAESGNADSEGTAVRQQLYQQLGRKDKPNLLASAVSLATRSDLDKTNGKHFLGYAVIEIFPPAGANSYYVEATSGTACAMP
jgi:hypothetical protein